MSPDDNITLPPVAARPPATRMTVVMILVLVVLLAALIVVGYSTRAIAQDRDGWRGVAIAQRDQINAQNAELSCRSQAALDTDRAAAELQITIGRGLAAVARGEDLTKYLAELDAAVVGLRDALDARQVSLATCKSATVDTPTTNPGG